MDEVLARVLAAWDLIAPGRRLRHRSTADDLRHAEGALGRPLPQAFRDLHMAAGAASAPDEVQLSLYPLVPLGDDADALSVTTASDLLRSWDWPVPTEMVVFGDDGSGSSFGLWLAGGDPDVGTPVVQIGEVFRPDCLAVVGDDLPGFLAGWSAAHLAITEPPDLDAALEVLGLPAELRASGGTDELFAARMRWANPGLPDRDPDPYERGLTAEQVRRLADP